jgi:hypothetical protein
MARLLRLEYAGACYHVVNRGNYRRDVFAEDGARKAFEQTLFEAAERFGWLLHAFVIMRNHFHLGVETPEPNLGDGMRWLQVTCVEPKRSEPKRVRAKKGQTLMSVVRVVLQSPTLVTMNQTQPFRRNAS